MKIIYMEQTLKLIAKTQGVEVAKAMEETGEIKYLKDAPYLVVELEKIL
jgi:hypothetical protein